MNFRSWRKPPEMPEEFRMRTPKRETGSRLVVPHIQKLDPLLPSSQIFKMAASDSSGDDSLYPIAVLIDELRNEDVQVRLYNRGVLMFVFACSCFMCVHGVHTVG